MRIHRQAFSLAAGLALFTGWFLNWGAQAQLATNLVTMDNAAILYSPFNWGVTTQAAKTINSGAYFKVIFSGTSCRLTTDTASNLPPYSQFWARVDGGPFAPYTLAKGNPTFTVAAGLGKRKHLLEVVIKSTSETIARWTKQTTAVVFTGLVLDSGATVAAPVRKPFNILIYGDSITEGVRVNGYEGITNDTDRNDALQVYSWLLSQELPAEVGVVGFGATGINTSGSGSVPILGKSYALLWAGQARSFSDPEPDLIIYNEGTNDGGSITSGLEAVVRALLKAAPNARQLLLLPFNGSHAAELKTVVATVRSSQVSFGDTKGFFNTADASDALHPYGYSHLASIAPQLATLVTPLLTLAPKGLKATATNSWIRLNWPALVGATNYNIQRASNSGGPYTWIAATTATNYNDFTATSLRAYYYVISASLRTGETANSGEVSATPVVPGRIGAHFNSTEGTLALSWPARSTTPTLWAATNLSPPVQWLPITNIWQDSNELLNTTVPLTAEGQQFFRLGE
jgi:lysophospholipase L1-like esterase